MKPLRFLKSSAKRMLDYSNFNRHLSLVELENGDWIAVKTYNKKEVIGQYRGAEEAFATLLNSAAMKRFKGLVITVERQKGDE